jgi:Fur family transcriptional regulator, ferric uptake regulator
MPVERATRQRHAIRSAIERAGRPVSLTEILDDARSLIDGIGVATVYRTLKKLAADGAIRVVTLPGDAARYELQGGGHHHHFQCTRCKRVFEVPGCPGDLSHLAPRGFTVEQHDITLYGRCADCARRKLPARS